VAWQWLPIAALAAASLSYAIHHVVPVEEHDAVVALLVVAAAAALSIGVGVLARPTERHLPAVIAIRPDATELRRIGRQDLGFCAALHAGTLEHGFFASLGHGFLRAYYATFLASPHAIALVATVRGAPVGLVVGSTDPRAHARWVLRRRGLRLAVRGAGILMLRPRLAVRFVGTRVARYRRAWGRARSAPAPTRSTQGTPAVLTHVAVVPGAQGAGVGRTLVEQFLSEAQARGASAAVLLTLEGSAGASSFYQQLGWRADGLRATFDGPPMAAFEIDLTPEP